MIAAGLILALCSTHTTAQGIDLADRPVSAIRVQGLVRVPQQLVLNQVRLAKGAAYNPRVVQEDIVRITHLGRFSSVLAEVEPQEDGSVIVAYIVAEQPLIADVRAVGNKTISEQELLAQVLIQPGDPVEPFLIDRAIKQIQKAYEKAGYFSTHVTVDQAVLDESNTLVFKIREGPKVRIRQIQFEGNLAFTAKQLQSKIQSNRYIFVLQPGVLNRQQLDADVARLRSFYHDRGYLDAQVGRKIVMSPDQKDAAVTFLIEEGRRYTIGSITVKGHTVFSQAQILETIPMKVGDVFMDQLQRRTQQAATDLYGKLGFIETTAQIDRLFHDKSPKVDILIRIEEGIPCLVGTISVRGNQLTLDKVIYREIRGLLPGRRFDRSGIETTQQRLVQSSLFSDAKITILGDPKDAYRDVLIDVKEANTGSLSFGAGISSDAGVLGAIDLVQRNFDIADLPESAGEFFTGKAFRGAGQFFSLNLQPGNELSRYAIGFREPHLMDTDYSLNTNLFFFEREREDWDEQRLGGSVGLGHRFGDVWSAAVRLRAEEIDVSNLDPSAPVDAFAVENKSTVTSVELAVTRNTTDHRILPTRGSVIEVSLARAGALGGDYDFTRLNAQYRQFWTVDEDFFGRRTVVSLRMELGYIFERNESPLFERFHAGGHRSFRGFRFRGVGPRGVRNDTMTIGDDPVGGDWLFLLGLEYSFPIYQDAVRAVVFADTGTVQDDFGLDEYRAAVGAGLRLKIPFLGQAPFALDFAIPVAKEDGDETQTVSFDLALPF